jgi:hypothetical protein
MPLTPEDLQQISVITAKAKDETIEAMRDMQTEILKGLEGSARGNFARLHRLEASDATTNTRLEAIEERLLALELRQRPPQ